MAVIHKVTLTPSKLELLASWLPKQPWYLGKGPQPELTKAGGFRLDDPQGDVGMEFMVVTDTSGDQPLVYHVPLSYRGAPLDGADHALVGTTEHEVLGRRWIYDGTHDPVLVAQLFALIKGDAEPQAQNVSNSPDLSVTGYFAETGHTAAIGSTVVANGADGTDLLVETTAASESRSQSGSQSRSTRQLSIRVNRILRPSQDGLSTDATRSRGHVTADWLLPDGTKARGLFAVVRNDAADPTTSE
ncbi:1,4-alpha-glucan branching protein [Streptomyces sp. NPDC050636]|uniref:maltokinase N-terminal cap-like domain-containing protein n=1 Tax=Streptomyces sp. NPDC050636 TaxID=3154510 RepID=UPI00343BB676